MAAAEKCVYMIENFYLQEVEYPDLDKKLLFKKRTLNGVALFNDLGIMLYGAPPNITEDKLEPAEVTQLKRGQYPLYSVKLQVEHIKKVIQNMYKKEPASADCTYCYIPVVLLPEKGENKDPILTIVISFIVNKRKRMLDCNGRVYSDFEDFLKTNKYPAGEIYYPLNGSIEEAFLENKNRYEILCRFRKTPNSGNIANVVDTIVGIVGIGSLFVPFGPIALGVMVGTTAYRTGTTINNLIDRGIHNQTLNPFKDKNAGRMWLEIASNLVSFAGSRLVLVKRVRALRAGTANIQRKLVCNTLVGTSNISDSAKRNFEEFFSTPAASKIGKELVETLIKKAIKWEVPDGTMITICDKFSFQIPPFLNFKTEESKALLNILPFVKSSAVTTYNSMRRLYKALVKLNSGELKISKLGMSEIIDMLVLIYDVCKSLSHTILIIMDSKLIIGNGVEFTISTAFTLLFDGVIPRIKLIQILRALTPQVCGKFKNLRLNFGNDQLLFDFINKHLTMSTISELFELSTNKVFKILKLKPQDILQLDKKKINILKDEKFISTCSPYLPSHQEQFIKIWINSIMNLGECLEYYLNKTFLLISLFPSKQRETVKKSLEFALKMGTKNVKQFYFYSLFSFNRIEDIMKTDKIGEDEACKKVTLEMLDERYVVCRDKVRDHCVGTCPIDCNLSEEALIAKIKKLSEQNMLRFGCQENALLQTNNYVSLKLKKGVQIMNNFISSYDFEHKFSAEAEYKTITFDNSKIPMIVVFVVLANGQLFIDTFKK